MKEITKKPMAGFALLSVCLALIALGSFELYLAYYVFGGICLFVGTFLLTGLVVINPNESSVVTLFGSYKGTVKENGFFWMNPFYIKKGYAL